jgi:N-acetyl-anhydromuramyl-L-alanine amidase AmpD
MAMTSLVRNVLRNSIFIHFILLHLAAVALAAAPQITDMPILWSEHREQLIREYALTHYSMDKIFITPQAVVVHWTASSTWESAYNYFYAEARGDGTLNVASHFLVGRDGQIYRLTPENALNRHIIGYNWCAIGIENVGGVGGAEDLTSAQLEANELLIRYLQEKYPSICYVFGHYQQDVARESGLYVENVAGYRSEKIDPGPAFMGALRSRLADTGLRFYEE